MSASVKRREVITLLGGAAAAWPLAARAQQAESSNKKSRMTRGDARPDRQITTET